MTTTGTSVRSLLRQPSYRRLWSARTVSQWGDVVQFTTMALLVLKLTGSAVGVSTVALLEAAPVLLLAPLAGPAVDRLPRVGVMVAADLMRAALAGVLVVWHGDVRVAYVVAFGLSAGAVFFNPAANSLLPALVAEDELVAANGGIWSAAVASQLALAPLAGVVVATVGFGAAFAVNAASFLASAAVLRGLGTVEPRRRPVGVGIVRPGLETLRVLSTDRLLRSLVFAQALAALSAGATSAMLVVLAQRRLHTSPSGYGLMLAAIAVGALAGPLLLARRRSTARAPTIFGAFALRSAVDATLASVTALPAALAALVGYGLGTSTGNVAFSSLLQSQVAAERRGRVFSAFDLVWHSMRLVSIAAGGVVADRFGVRAVFYAGAVLLAAAAATGLATSGGRPR